MGIETALLSIAAVSTVGSVALGVEQRNEQEKARRAQRNIQRRQQQREKLSAFREQQIAQAQLTQGAAASGTLDTSGFAGAYSSIGSTAASNVGFANQIQSIQEDIAKRLERASELGTARQIVTGKPILE